MSTSKIRQERRHSEPRRDLQRAVLLPLSALGGEYSLFLFPQVFRARLLSICLIGFTLCFAGCSILKPSGVNPQSFVLSPLPAAAAPSNHATGGVGVALVKIPAYLFKNSIAVREGTNQLAYLEKAIWAERLDRGLQRIFAANLASLLRTERISLSAWRPQDVDVEVFVTVEEFDVDRQGRGVFLAWWRLLSPGHEKELKAGQFRAVHSGPPPEPDTQGAAATMSELAADLSREIAEAIKAAVPNAFP